MKTFALTFLILTLLKVTMAESGGLRKMQSLAELWRVDDLVLTKEDHTFKVSASHGVGDKISAPKFLLYAKRSALENDASSEACSTSGGEFWMDPSAIAVQNGLETTAVDLAANTTSSSWSFRLAADFNQKEIYKDGTVMFCVFFAIGADDKFVNFRELAVKIDINLIASFSSPPINLDMTADLCEDAGIGKSKAGQVVPFCVCADDYPNARVESILDLEFRLGPDMTLPSVAGGKLHKSAANSGCSRNASGKQCCRVDTLLPSQDSQLVSATGSVLMDVGGQRRLISAEEVSQSTEVRAFKTDFKVYSDPDFKVYSDPSSGASKAMLWLGLGIGAAVVALLTAILGRQKWHSRTHSNPKPESHGSSEPSDTSSESCPSQDC